MKNLTNGERIRVRSLIAASIVHSERIIILTAAYNNIKNGAYYGSRSGYVLPSQGYLKGYLEELENRIDESERHLFVYLTELFLLNNEKEILKSILKSDNKIRGFSSRELNDGYYFLYNNPNKAASNVLILGECKTSKNVFPGKILPYREAAFHFNTLSSVLNPNLTISHAVRYLKRK